MKKLIAFLVSLAVSVSVAVTASAHNAENTLEERIYNAILGRETSVNVEEYNIGISDVKKLEDAYTNIWYTHPELFCLNRQYGYSYTSGKIVTVELAYTVDEETYEGQLKEYKKHLKKITSRVSEDFSDLEKVLFIHEYLTNHFKYDETYTIHDAYNFFMQSQGVCEAYTLAFTAIMNELGVFCTTAFNDLESHCWNIVGIGGENYHIDVTQDDPVFAGGDAPLYSMDCSKHNFFLCSDADIKKAGNHKEWYTVGGDYPCNDSSYQEKIWADYEHPLIYCQDNWYHFDINLYQDMNDYQVYGEAVILKIDGDFVSSVEEYTVKLPAWNIYGNTYIAQFEIYAVNDIIYGTSHNRIWSYNPALKEFGIIETEYSNIYSSRYKGRGIIELGIKNFETNETEFVDYQLHIMGDTDNDRLVGATDLVSFTAYILTGKCDFNLEFVDFNDDAQIDVLDFIKMKKSIG